MKVLIIDDEKDIGFVLGLELKFSGHECVCFESALDAQKYLESELTVDVIVCDFQMPQLNGLEFFRWVKTKNFKGPFYLLTGEPTMDTQFLLEQGITEVLFKPQDLNKLSLLIK